MYRYVSTLDDLLDLREWFGKQPYVAMDTETTGLDVHARNFRVRLIQFGNKTDAWVMDGEDYKGFVKDMLRVYRGRIVGHNLGAYDYAALRAVGIILPMEKVDDTLVAMRLARPHQPAALKTVTARYISPQAAESQGALHKAMKMNKWDWDTVPHDFGPYRFYAAMDVILNSRIYEHPVCQEGLNSPVYEMEMDVRAIASEMEWNGMRVDLDFAREKAQGLREEAVAIAAQLARWLLDRNVALSVMTGGGAPSVAKDALEKARYSATGEAADVMDAVLRSRKITKMASSYFDNFVKMSTDGLLHPQIQTIQAKTGRMSITQPAMQTLPRVTEDPDTRTVRQAIIPRNPGELIVSSDFSQIELRVIAALSEDAGLIEAFREADESGGDIFVSAMRLVYNDETLEKSDPRRSLIKNTFYGSAYGAGVAKMAQTAGVGVEDMRMVSDAVFKRFVGMKKYMKVCEHEANDNDGWVTTPMGRRIWVDPEFSYKALNAKVQGFAGDIFKTTMVNLAKADLLPYMVCPVHDEVVFSIPEEDLEEVSHVIAAVMPYNELTVPVPAEPSPGVTDWSLAK
jgi:DNA polymerase-1